jgi:hypothetical protein
MIVRVHQLSVQEMQPFQSLPLFLPNIRKMLRNTQDRSRQQGNGTENGQQKAERFFLIR